MTEISNLTQVAADAVHTVAASAEEISSQSEEMAASAGQLDHTAQNMRSDQWVRQSLIL